MNTKPENRIPRSEPNPKHRSANPAGCPARRLLAASGAPRPALLPARQTGTTVPEAGERGARTLKGGDAAGAGRSVPWPSRYVSMRVQSWLLAWLFILSFVSFAVPSAPAATVYWVGGSGDWNTAANWSSAPALPGPDDDVVLDVPGNVTITLSSGAHTIRSLLSQEPFTLSGGSLTITANSQLADFTLSGGTLSGSGDVTVSGALSWTGGTMSGSGRILVVGSGTLTLGGTANKHLERLLQNEGAASWTGGPVFLSGGTLVNLGTFTASSGGTLYW